MTGNLENVVKTAHYEEVTIFVEAGTVTSVVHWISSFRILELGPVSVNPAFVVTIDCPHEARPGSLEA